MQRFQRAGPSVNSPEHDSRAVVNSEESDAGLWTNSAESNFSFSPNGLAYSLDLPCYLNWTHAVNITMEIMDSAVMGVKSKQKNFTNAKVIRTNVTKSSISETFHRSFYICIP
jgi:hypothetical protein